MEFEPDVHDPLAARYSLFFEFTASTIPGAMGLAFNLQTTIGDQQPVEAQQEAFEALVELLRESGKFNVIGATRDYRSYSNLVLPPLPEA